MLLALLSFLSFADTPDIEIVVESEQYEEIYVEKPRIKSETALTAEDYETVIFTFMNNHHSFWYKHGKIGAIYNSETIVLSGTECDYNKNSLLCAHNDGMWLLRSVISVTQDQASIHLLLFDDHGVVIGQSSYTSKKKTRVIEREREIERNRRDILSSLYGQNSQVVIQEDLEPSVIVTPPKLTNQAVSQAVIMLYNSLIKSE
jgi:hypothetical protein